MNFNLNNCRVYSALQLIIIYQLCTTALSFTKVEVETPQTIARDGEVLTVYCRVWGIEQGYVVQHSRNLFGSKITEHLSWNDELLGGVDDRFFLATRQLSDNSMVYFLSILHVTREDSGDYRCQLLKPTDDGFAEVDEDFVTADILYFPSEPPVCSSLSSMTISAGDEVILSCSSEAGNPQIDITWDRTGSQPLPMAKTSMDDNKIAIEIKFTASVDDDQTIFVCQSRSSSFPSRIESCHLGPLIVNPSSTHSHNTALGSPGSRTLKPSSNYPPAKTPFCERVCPYFSTQIMPWMGAAVGAAILTFLFIIADVTLCLKLRHMKQVREARSKNYSYPPLPGNSHDIYVELGPEKRPVESLVEHSNYMALQRPRLELPLIYDKNDGDHYAVLPRATVVAVQSDANVN